MTSLQIPESSSTVEVSIIDTTAQLYGIPISHFFGPALKGFETFTACAYAFLVTHTDGKTGKKRRIVFDLGPPKDWENDLPPAVVGPVRGLCDKIEIEKYVSEILEENGVPTDSIEAVIWSHAHFDHIGRVSLFPPNVSLVLGPGLKEAIYPGYPALETSPVLERDFADRNVTSLDFTTSSLTIGDFSAIDYFGDGSFYLLSAPGHAIGHVNALARTTSSSSTNAKSTFILMGADSYHHASQLRPSKQTPLPDEVPGPIPTFTRYTSVCPGHIFDIVHPSSSHRKDEIPSQYTDVIVKSHNDSKTTPHFTISAGPDGGSIAVDLDAARNTIHELQKFDADENVFLVSAHDRSLYEVLEYFPKSVANGWKAKGWKEKGRWRYLGDLKKALDIVNQEEK